MFYVRSWLPYHLLKKALCDHPIGVSAQSLLPQQVLIPSSPLSQLKLACPPPSTHPSTRTALKAGENLISLVNWCILCASAESGKKLTFHNYKLNGRMDENLNEWMYACIGWERRRDHVWCGDLSWAARKREHHKLRQSRKQGADCVWEDGEFGLSLLSFICRWGLQVERSIYTVGNIGQSQKKWWSSQPWW